MQREESYRNRVAKLIDKVEELKRINNYNINNNNDVSNYFDFYQSLDEKQKELLNQLLKSLTNNVIKSQKEIEECRTRDESEFGT